LARKPVETYPLEIALEATAAIIRTHGYISKKESATSGRHPTSRTLGIWLNSAVGGEGATDLVTDDDRILAGKAMAWLKALTDKGPTSSESDFDRSMRLLSHGGYRNVAPSMITKSDFGFVACVYATMDRAANREVKKAEAKESASTSEYMGSVKKRAEFFVKLIGKTYSDNVGCYIYKIKDRKGNLGVFFSSDSAVAEVNECFLAKMTPKRHSINDYHGGKETVFNRVKVVENVGKPSGA